MTSTSNLLASKHIYRQNAIGYGSQIAGVLSLSVANLVLPMILGPRQFGLITVVTAIATMAIAVFHEAIGSFVISKLASSTAEAFEICRSGMALALVAAALILADSHSIARWLKLPGPDASIVLWAAPLAVMMHFNFLGISVFTAALRMEVVALLNIVAGLTLIAVPLLFFAVWHSAEAVVAGTNTSYFLTAIVLFILLRKFFPGASSMRHKISVAEVARNGLSYASSSLFTATLSSGLVLICSDRRSLEEAAFFKIAISITVGLGSFVPAHRFTIFASMVQLAGEDFRRTKYLARLGRYAGSVVALLALLQATVGARVIVMVFGQKFAPAAPYVALFSIALPLQFAVNIVVALAWSQGRQKRVAFYFVIGALVAVVSAFVMSGMSLGYVVSYELALMVVLLFTMVEVRMSQFGAFLRSCFRPGAIALFMYAVSIVLPVHGSMLQVAWTGALLVAGYSLLLFASKTIDFHEVRQLLVLLREGSAA